MVSTTGQTTDPEGKLIKSAFRIWGGIATRQGPELRRTNDQQVHEADPSSTYFDFLSYAQLPMNGLSIDIQFNLLGDAQSGYSAQHKQLTFNADRITPSTAEPKFVKADTQVSLDAVAVREGSLLQEYPVKLLRLFASEHSPDTEGYGPLKCPPLTANVLNASATTNWYGFEFAVQLGSMGSLAPNVVLTADMLFAWSPETTGYYIGMKLPGMGPLTELVDIEGSLNLVPKMSHSIELLLCILRRRKPRFQHQTRSI